MNPEALQLLTEQDFCVLATIGEQGPHCSLMSHLCSADGERLYLVTSSRTGKFANLTANPRVSLLVDDRGTGPANRVRALGVSGRARALPPGDEADAWLARFRARHPQLKAICDDPEARVVEVAIQGLQLFEGPTRSLL